MHLDEATALIFPALPPGPGSWLDLGAGTGLFSRALAARLGAGGRVLAVDRDARALAALRSAAQQPDGAAEIATIVGDFTRLDALPELRDTRFDGVLLANALHYAPDAAQVLRDAARRLHAGGRIVVVEYDRRAANPWVPYPVPLARLRTLAADARLGSPAVVGERPSDYGGVMYCAVLAPAPAAPG